MNNRSLQHDLRAPRRVEDVQLSEPQSGRRHSAEFMEVSLDGPETSTTKGGSPGNVSEEDTTCDYSFCAPAGCQRLRSRKLMLLWLCVCTFTQSMTVNGLVNSVITTLERRYRLNSTESGAIASLYDVGVTLVLIPLSYFGSSWRRLRTLSCGMFIMAIGAFLFALPQATSGVYEYLTPVPPLCYRGANVSYAGLCQNNNNAHLSNYKFLFWLSHLLIGVGASPLYTLGTAYLDDNLSTKSSAVYLGIFYMMSLLGPGAGYLGASLFLSIYVDIGRAHPGLTSANKEFWVGAWWLGFVVSGVLALMTVIPLYGFPTEMPKTAEIKAKKQSEAFGSSEQVAGAFRMTAKDFKRNVVLLATNPTFMFVSLSGFLESMLASGISTFGPKYLERVFELSASWATQLFGFVLIPSGGAGMLIGGLVIRCFDLSLLGILRFQFAGGVLVLPFLLIFLLSCGSKSGGGIAGVTTTYTGVGSQVAVNLTSACNVGCQCLSDSSLFEPSCGVNGLTYYSPCYAGCLSKTTKGYTNCTCISSTVTSNTTAQVTSGSCQTGCPNLPYFMAVFAIIIFLVFLIVTPALTATLRSVPGKLKTFGLGVQWLIIRIFGTIPGPILFGALIDRSCAVWNDRCKVRGSCAFYNGLQLRDTILIVGFVLKSLSAICLMIAWLTYKQNNSVVSPTEVQPNGEALPPAESSREKVRPEGFDNPAVDITPL